MSDHLDPPAVAGLRDRDITDLYAFHPPGFGSTSGQDLSRMVLVLAVNPLSVAGTPNFFSDDAEYQILVDTDGDAEEDIEIEVEFSRPKKGRQKFEIEMEGGEKEIERKGRTGRVRNLGRGMKFFAGLLDDPFFFDLGVLSGTPSGVDTFAGTNVSAIVLEVPTSILTPDGPSIGVWGAVEGSDQIDRVGRPAISTVLITSKDDFNASEPKDDVADFTGEVIAGITALGNPGGAAGLAAFLLPDILTLDTSTPTAFPNGRNLDDDVIDIELHLLTAGALTTDGIPANDVPFRRQFPYLARPH